MPLAMQNLVPQTMTDVRLRPSGSWEGQWVEVTELATTPIPIWLTHALDEIRAIEQLPVDWDGFGSPILQPDAMGAAVSLIGQIASSGSPLPRPTIAPVSGGGLQVEFEVGDNALEFEVLPGGDVELLLVLEHEPPIEVQARVPQFDIPVILNLLISGDLS